MRAFSFALISLFGIAAPNYEEIDSLRKDPSISLAASRDLYSRLINVCLSIPI